jgi:putative ABC transport system ATP-binding protein
MSSLSVDGSPSSAGAPNLPAPLVVAEDLGRTYRTGSNDVHALRGVSLAVPRGTLVAVRGRSGSGKTTLLNLLGGLDRPDTGRVTVDGREVSTLSEDELVDVRRRTVGFVFQSFGLIPILSAAENVGVPLRLIRADPQQREERVRLLLSLVGLADAAAQRPYELSGGQQQRLAIARALANRPPLLLADEPTGQLDSQTGRMIMELLRALVRSQGITALVATHDPALLAVADRVIELRDGAVVSDESADASVGVERLDTGHTGRP